MIDEIESWQAVVDRDARFDGRFVYAVRSTRVYCRPSCPSRRPRREYVAFFASPDDAEQAGFRACLRCQPRGASEPAPLLALIERVCRAIEAADERPPTLEELAQRFGLSAGHLQRTFKRLVGVTPRQYADACRVRRLKERLRESASVTAAVYEAGYESSSQVYAAATRPLGMPPGDYRRGGANQPISYTVVPCRLGMLLVAATERGICAVRLGGSELELEQELLAEYPAATVARDRSDLAGWVAALLDHLEGRQPHLDLPIDVRATAFQRQVWEALRAIPYGQTRSYQAVAQALGRPQASRAVAQACASNPVALVVPCHRVIQADGGLGGYRWGIERKRALLDEEELRTKN